MYYDYCSSPIGLIEIGGTEVAVTGLYFVDERQPATVSHPVVRQAVEQVGEYLQGLRRTFEVALAPEGTDFQQLVWRALLDIPYGQVVSYQDIARAIGRPNAVRAVGAANGQNPISIIIPCHRVIGSSGDLVGYGGGLWRKEWLLRHEGYLLL